MQIIFNFIWGEIVTNILIVDDNEKIRKLIEIYLKREGFKVFHGENGEVALDILDGIKIDLIIADIMMPIMDGYELVEELRTANYNLPILMVTAKNTYPDKNILRYIYIISFNYLLDNIFYKV